MKRKKFMAVFLMAAVMGMSVLSACGSSSGGESTQSASTATSTDVSAETGGSSATEEQSTEPVAVESSGSWDFTMATAMASTSWFYKAGEYFIEKVNEYTNGQVTITLYGDAQLGADRDICEGLQRGSIDMALLNYGSCSGYDPRLDVVNTPYLFPTYEMADAFLYDEGAFFGDILEGYMNDLGIHGLSLMENEYRAVSNNKRPVTTAADMAGLKLRVPESPALLALFEAFGSVVTPMAYSELYTALQQGTVDGQENGPLNMVDSKLYEVQKYYTSINHLNTANGICISNTAWESLPADIQAALEKAANEASIYQRENARADVAKAIQTMAESGVEVYELSEEEMQTFVEVGLSVWPVLEEMCEPGIYDKLRQAVEDWNSKDWDKAEWKEHSAQWVQ